MAAETTGGLFHFHMTKLENLTQGAAVTGILPNQAVTVVNVKWHGSGVVELTYKDAAGRPENTLLYRDNEAALITRRLQFRASVASPHHR
jgi:spore germination protein GerM